MKQKSDFWPSDNQLYLLKACTLNEVDAKNNFELWKSSLDLKKNNSKEQLLATVFDQIDAGSQRLLPLLHYNLSNTLANDPVIQAIKGYNRYVWSKNQIIFFQVKKVINLLRANNIKHFFVKGVPLAKFYYGSDSIRPMADLDIVIKEKDIQNTWQLLCNNGWRDRFSDVPFDYKEIIIKSRCMINHKNDELDLHWRTFKDSFVESEEDILWEHLVDFKLDDQIAQTLNSTYQLVHTIIHGMQWNELPSFRWICDSLIILRRSDINWDQLQLFASQKKYTLRLSNAFEYLVKNFDAKIPQSVLDHLKNQKTSKYEHKFFNLLLTNHASGTVSHIMLRHYQFRLYYPQCTLTKEVWLFLKNYKSNWGSKNLLTAAFQVVGTLLGIAKHPYEKFK